MCFETWSSKRKEAEKLQLKTSDTQSLNTNFSCIMPLNCGHLLLQQKINIQEVKHWNGKWRTTEEKRKTCRYCSIFLIWVYSETINTSRKNLKPSYKNSMTSQMIWYKCLSRLCNYTSNYVLSQKLTEWFPVHFHKPDSLL